MQFPIGSQYELTMYLAGLLRQTDGRPTIAIPCYALSPSRGKIGGMLRNKVSFGREFSV